MKIVSDARDGFIGIISHEHRDLDSTAHGKLPHNPLRLSVDAGGRFLSNVGDTAHAHAEHDLNTGPTLATNHHQLQPRLSRTHTTIPIPPVLQTQAGGPSLRPYASCRPARRDGDAER
jgi:hypothetical protein